MRLLQMLASSLSMFPSSSLTKKPETNVTGIVTGQKRARHQRRSKLKILKLWALKRSRWRRPVLRRLSKYCCFLFLKNGHWPCRRTGFKKQRPGRKVGSGVGEVRKQEHEYSVKKKAVNARKSFATKTSVQKSLVRADGADRVAKHRAINKLKNSAQYQAMTDEKKKIAELITLSEFWQSR